MSSLSNPDAEPLLRLLADGAAHSGARLAAELGITRAAVWKRVQRLRVAGHPIEAQPGRGYRWLTPAMPLSAARIRQALRRRANSPPAEVLVETAVDSTNRVLRALAPDQPTLLFADRQTGGRGRRGRSWYSPPGGIYGSLAWTFHDLPHGPVGLSVLVGLEIALALRRLGADGVAVKWPNDLVIGDAKLGGILIELTAEAGGPSRVVVGLGLNWRQPAADTDLSRATAGLVDVLAATAHDRNRIAAAVADAAIDACIACPDRLAQRFEADWLALDALAGRPIRLILPTGERAGIAEGIAADGALRVRHGDELTLYHSGEVSVRMAP